MLFVVSKKVLKNYNLWDILLNNNHDVIKGIIEFLSFPHISTNSSMIRIVSVNKQIKRLHIQIFA